MLRYITLPVLSLFLFCSPLMAEENHVSVQETHIHFERGLLYCDVQTFSQEAYILKVLGGGSPVTVYWQFEVLEHRNLWFDTSKGLVKLGRQVIPDLVLKRWLMRDLSSGVIEYTTDVQMAMQFLTVMSRAAVIDVSLLIQGVDYLLKTKLYMYETEREQSSWWQASMNWGMNMGEVHFRLPYDEVPRE